MLSVVIVLGFLVMGLTAMVALISWLVLSRAYQAWKAEREARNWVPWICGLDSGFEIEPGSTMLVTARRAPALFQCERFVPASPEDGEFFRIMDIKIDSKSVLRTSTQALNETTGEWEVQHDTGLPVAAFANAQLNEAMQRPDRRGLSLRPGLLYAFVVKNESDQPRRFRAAMIGAVRVGAKALGGLIDESERGTIGAVGMHDTAN